MNYFVYRDASRDWRWYLRAGNNEKIANSGEGYRNKQDCLRAIALVKASSGASVLELEG